MKSFLSNNWYKLMVASSLFIFSVGFFIYAVSPTYANTEKINVSAKKNNVDNSYTVVSNGYLYFWSDYEVMRKWVEGNDKTAEGFNVVSTVPKKRKLPL